MALLRYERRKVRATFVLIQGEDTADWVYYEESVEEEEVGNKF